MADGDVQAYLFNRRDDAIGPYAKWKYELTLHMVKYWDYGIGPGDAVLAAWDAGDLYGVRVGMTGYWLVVIEPHHRHAYPVMVAV